MYAVGVGVGAIVSAYGRGGVERVCMCMLVGERGVRFRLG